MIKLALATAAIAASASATAQPPRSNLLTGTEWTIAAIDGRPVRMETLPGLRFTADRVQGRICNRLGGRYVFARGKMTMQQVVATRMACPGEPMRAEAAFMRAIAQPLYVHRGRADTLVLSRRGASITLRRYR